MNATLDSTFGLVADPCIDAGELHGLPAEHCFTLGYELATIDALLISGQPIAKPVHRANRHRIARFCDKAGRRCTFAPLTEAGSGWLWLDVPGEI